MDIGQKVHTLPKPEDYLKLMRVVCSFKNSVMLVFKDLTRLTLKLTAEACCGRGADVRNLRWCEFMFQRYPANTAGSLAVSRQPLDVFCFMNPKSKVQPGDRFLLLQMPVHRQIYQCGPAQLAVYAYMQFTVIGQ
jgi:hypothetical protein